MERNTVIHSGPPRTPRTFWLWWLGQTVSTLGTNVTLIVMPWVVLSLTHSALQTGIATAIEFVPYLVLSIPFGALVDRWHRKHIIVLCHVVRGMALASIPAAALSLHLTMSHIYGVSFLVSSASVLCNAASDATLPNLVQRSSIHKANRRIQLGNSFGSLVGAPLGGLLMTCFPATAILLIDACSYLFAALCVIQMGVPFQTTKPKTVSWNGMFDGLKFIVGSPLFRSTTSIMALSNFSNFAVMSILVYHAREDLGLSANATGDILGVWGIGLLIGSTVTRWLEPRIHSGRIMLLSRCLAVLPPALYLLAKSAVLMATASALTGLVMVLWNIQSTSLRQLHVPDELRGRAASANSMLAWMMIPAGSLVGGIVGKQFGSQMVFVIAIGVQTLGMVIMLCSPLTNVGIRGAIKAKDEVVA